MKTEEPAIKWSSCFRHKKQRNFVIKQLNSLELINKSPRAGDVVVLEVSSEFGIYDHVENEYGRDVRLYKGDILIGVLADRESGTNITGRVPSGPLSAGAVLSLLAVGGIVGELIEVPFYCAKAALNLKIKGFIKHFSGRIANVMDEQVLTAGDSIGQITKPIIIVAGTSAESGKTSLMCEAIRALSDIRIAAVKMFGTGRLRDLLRYKDSGAVYASDYVNYGLPTTYGVNEEILKLVLHQVIKDIDRGDLILLEYGGDLLGAGVNIGLGFAAAINAPVFLCVNDALAAKAGLQELQKYQLKNVFVASLRQNCSALKMRLQHENTSGIFDIHDRDAVHKTFSQSLT